MECIRLEKVSFSYPGRKTPILNDINLDIKSGDFVTVCGRSGCGKTTLLRLLKPVISPHGLMNGKIYFQGKELSEYDFAEQAQKIGFVFQNPDNGIVTDKVWHELAFGLESLGVPNNEIRTRVSEIASYFGIQNWFHKPVSELSGGQKQILNLASVMVMQPSVLVLDEPTSQLDPIAASEFIKTLEKINHELGTTIILAEQRLDDAIPVSNRVIFMDRGCIVVDDTPQKFAFSLINCKNDMVAALPVPMRIYCECEAGGDCPVDVKHGREWLYEVAKKKEFYSFDRIKNNEADTVHPIVELRDVWYKYSKDSEDIVKGLDLKVFPSEIYAIVGGNGAGKSTTLSLISGINFPYRGDVLIKGIKASAKNRAPFSSVVALPQNPQALFVQKNVYLELEDGINRADLSPQEINDQIYKVARLCNIDELLDEHPYDLSGGEQQRVALAKVLLTNPEILVLDEPTKGLDACFKEELADILHQLQNSGVTVIIVSHDIEFCASVADRCAMFFDGNITSNGEPYSFFDGNNFYTTSANRMSRGIIPSAILAEDVIYACTGRKKEKNTSVNLNTLPSCSVKEYKGLVAEKKLSKSRLIFGIIFAFLFIIAGVFGENIFSLTLAGNVELCEIFAVLFAMCSLWCFFSQNNYKKLSIYQPHNNQRLSAGTILAVVILLLAIPATILGGIYFLDDRKYYFISILIIVETMIPFIMIFEKRKPKARELVLISTLCAIAVVGRAAFFMVPQFKPVIAVIIISGLCFGAETGFFVGAVTGFVSNMLFGQGPWTPWQMFAFGIIGFTAGILCKKSLIGKSKLSVSIFGAISTFLFYGGIMNASYIFQSNAVPSLKAFISVYIAGLPFDIIHSASTAIFLWLLVEPMVEKLERIKVKYGIIKN